MNTIMTEHTYKSAILNFNGGININDPSWLNEFRAKARERFRQVGFPNRKWEAWKYMNLEPLLKGQFQWDHGSPSLRGEVEATQRVASPDKNYILENLSSVLARDPEGIEKYFERQADEENPFALINAFSFRDGVFLKVLKNVQIAQPISLTFDHNANTAFATAPRIIIELEDGASAEIIVEQANSASPFFCNAAADIQLGKNAQLRVYYIDHPGEGSYHFMNERVTLGEGASLKRIVVADGEGTSRDDVTVNLNEGNSECLLEGLSVLNGNAQAFFHATVHHRVPCCTSRQVYKNILSGKSQAEYNSLVHVWRGAEKSNSQQMDRNLLLSDHARAYSRPQLKIDADDVQCNHGAATGRMEENEIFYLRSRGLDKETAKVVLTEGFTREILDHIGPVSLRNRLKTLASQQIREMLEEGMRGGPHL